VTACRKCGASIPEGRTEVCPLCFLMAEIPPALLGENIELLEEIGRGGMGVVYKARHLRLGRFVAVKFLAEALDSQPDFQRRLEREARALAAPNHPNVVAVYDFGTEDDRSYIVMEYVEGRGLNEGIPWSPEAARDIVLQICDALAYAHRHGMVHRDIKPQNILLDRDGRVKVSDFGIARLIEGSSSSNGWTVTDPRGIVGTPHYMAPEAVTGAPPDPRMDVYSVGILLHEMVKGRLPFPSPEGLLAPLDRVVRKALAREPEGRYQNMDEMQRDLAGKQVSAQRLPPDELNWLRAVAMLQALATAASLWAFLLSVTPRIVDGGALVPLIMVGTEKLADGRLVSRARFETSPTLVALGMWVVAIAGLSLLRRHWREMGLEGIGPNQPLAEGHWVLRLGVLSLLVYFLRKVLEVRGQGWASSYIPLFGGAIEVGVLFFVWAGILEAWRTSRPLWREMRLWLGLGLALIPPVSELFHYLLEWRP